MNTNIQTLIKSFSPEKRAEIQAYVVKNMTAEIQDATVHGSVTEAMQNELEKLIIDYLEIHYPDDIKHTLNVAKKDVEDQLNDLVNKQLDFLATSPVMDELPANESIHDENAQQLNHDSIPDSIVNNMGTKARTHKVPDEGSLKQPEVRMETNEQVSLTMDTTRNQTVVDEQHKPTNDDDFLSENTSYTQRHDRENRFLGFQGKVYKLLSYTDDETAESYFRIVMIVGAIMVFLGAWNLFNDLTTISSMQNYFHLKTPVYMKQLADFCQTSMSNIQAFQQCVHDRQSSLILSRRMDGFKDFLIALFGGFLIFITYFLKLNYRGRDSYRDEEEV